MRRTIDVLAASLALVFLSPVLLAVALVIVLDSPGGVFHGSWRVGKDGSPFRMWKLRTMVKDAAAMGSITGRNDPRITRLGRILRRTKLDELPQFLNVLLGDMTLVGPRPESPDMVALYTPAQRAVLAAKPGITGRVQLDSGEESESIPEGVKADAYYVRHLMEKKLRLDIQYLEIRTAATDVHIVFETAAYVLQCLFHALTGGSREKVLSKRCPL